MDTQKINLSEYFPTVTFGDGVQLCGVRNIAIGEGSCISDGVWLNVCDRDDKIRLRIGKSVLVGRRGVISTGGFLEIGDYTIIGPNVYVSDADHDYRDINVPKLLGGITAGRTVVVEENCWLCMNSVISGNITIGRGSVVGANAVVLKDIPPFTVVVGNPSQIVKMWDTVEKDWVRVKTGEDYSRVMANREKTGIPSREEYAESLSKCGAGPVIPVVAGREEHIL